MTRDRLDDLFQECADLGINVEWEDLGQHRRAHYRHSLQLIVLNRRLSRRMVTASLAHELGHQAFGDRCSTPRAERRAWEYAAMTLVSVREYAAAEEIVGCHVAALAIELDTTADIVTAWRRRYARLMGRMEPSGYTEG